MKYRIVEVKGVDDHYWDVEHRAWFFWNHSCKCDSFEAARNFVLLMNEKNETKRTVVFETG